MRKQTSRSSNPDLYHRLLTFGTDGKAMLAAGAAAIAPCCPADGAAGGAAAGTVPFEPAAGAGDIAPISGIAPNQELA